jgi:hypothetical protein
MAYLLAHFTEQELPSFWLALAIGFVSGVAATLALLARKLK